MQSFGTRLQARTQGLPVPATGGFLRRLRYVPRAKYSLALAMKPRTTGDASSLRWIA